ncbi:hypothetical protein [Actinosynnema pretiosum]|uniref:Uncharacterized protein n=1 Tax=Actinosynnema pretiosum TaxID=42197 RepID=A0A290Z1N6_9PSEU|nr:hypothetical protein [Actinosynnema pretiosum]ATE52941.1 hypothetical protein CNX65_06315 [Actinosynnema pretiosum]
MVAVRSSAIFLVLALVAAFLTCEVDLAAVRSHGGHSGGHSSSEEKIPRELREAPKFRAGALEEQRERPTRPAARPAFPNRPNPPATISAPPTEPDADPWTSPPALQVFRN